MMCIYKLFLNSHRGSQDKNNIFELKELEFLHFI